MFTAFFTIINILLVTFIGDTVGQSPQSSNDQTTYTNWQEAKDVLIAAKAIWLSHDVTSYTYHNKGSCFCMWCYIAPKYIVIDSNQATHVEFDTIADQTCGNDDINTPISDNYYDITYYYDKAIAHAQKGIDANCSPHKDALSQDMICGGSITFAYNPDLLFPTYLSLAYGPFIADAGQGWSFKCVTPLNYNADTDLSKYTANCYEFTWPATDVCTLPKATGPCRAAFSRYYYNSKSGKCETFIYGGCQSNGNNFMTLQECQAACTNDICQLPKQVGSCKGSFPRYYYNSVSDKCEQFIYGGCDGNSNNFESLTACQTKCISDTSECCAANIGKSKYIKTCPKNDNEKKCLRKKDGKSGNNVCQWMRCSDVGYCEWDGMSGKKRISKKQCGSKTDKTDCVRMGNCIWKSGSPSSEYLEELDEIEMVENEYELFGNISISESSDGIKAYHVYIVLGILLLIVMCMVYKRYRLSKEIRMMNRQQKETDPLLVEQYI